MVESIVRFMLGDYADEFLALNDPAPIHRRVPAHYNPEPMFGLRAARRCKRTAFPVSQWRVAWGDDVECFVCEKVN